STAPPWSRCRPGRATASSGWRSGRAPPIGPRSRSTPTSTTSTIPSSSPTGSASRAGASGPSTTRTRTFPCRSVTRSGSRGRPAGWRGVRYAGGLSRGEISALLARIKVGVIPLQPIANYVAAYPVKMFEYLAAGLPIVAIDVPRWRAIVEQHDCGVTVPFGATKQLGDAIAALLDNDDRARAMGERARKAAEERYSWETQAAALVGLYEEL